MSTLKGLMVVVLAASFFASAAAAKTKGGYVSPQEADNNSIRPMGMQIKRSPKRSSAQLAAYYTKGPERTYNGRMLRWGRYCDEIDWTSGALGNAVSGGGGMVADMFAPGSSILVNIVFGAMGSDAATRSRECHEKRNAYMVAHDNAVFMGELEARLVTLRAEIREEVSAELREEFHGEMVAMAKVFAEQLQSTRAELAAVRASTVPKPQAALRPKRVWEVWEMAAAYWSSWWN